MTVYKEVLCHSELERRCIKCTDEQRLVSVSRYHRASSGGAYSIYSKECLIR